MRYFGDDQWFDYDGQAHKVPRADKSAGLNTPDPNVPTITWLGHSSTLVQYHGINILTDPIFSDIASPVCFAGPERITPVPVSIEQLPPIDIVLISHNHYDHLDEASVKQIGDQATWMVPLRYKSWFSDLGINRVIEFDWWDSQQHGQILVTATPSQHWTGRGLFDRYQQLWAAWAVQIDGFKFWFAGDTGYNDMQFKEIGQRLGPFDLGIIPIGAYAPRWFMQDMHVNPEEAVQIHLDIGARFSVGVHWGTFPLTAEPIDEPPRRLKAAAEGLQSSDFVSLALGESRAVPLQRE